MSKRGLASGPMAAGLLLHSDDFPLLIATAIVALAVSGVAMLAAARRIDRLEPEACPRTPPRLLPRWRFPTHACCTRAALSAGSGATPTAPARARSPTLPITEPTTSASTGSTTSRTRGAQD